MYKYIIGLGLLLLTGCGVQEPKFKVGDCLVNYNVLKILGISNNKYVLGNKTSTMAFSINYVNDNYAKVNCKETELE